MIIGIYPQSLTRKSLPLCGIAQKGRQQLLARHALLEGFRFVGVRAELVSELEVQRRRADLIGGQGLGIRRLQCEGQISGRLVARVKKCALCVGQCGATGRH